VPQSAQNASPENIPISPILVGQRRCSLIFCTASHRSWWKEELPSEEEYQTAWASLEEHGWKVDYIITHCGPTSVQDELCSGFYKADLLTNFLNEAAERCEFRYWFLGHYHTNCVIRKKFAILYEMKIAGPERNGFCSGPAIFVYGSMVLCGGSNRAAYFPAKKKNGSTKIRKLLRRKIFRLHLFCPQ